MKERIFKGRKVRSLLGVVLALTMVVMLMPLSSMTVYANAISSDETKSFWNVDEDVDISSGVTITLDDCMFSVDENPTINVYGSLNGYIRNIFFYCDEITIKVYDGATLNVSYSSSMDDAGLHFVYAGSPGKTIKTVDDGDDKNVTFGVFDVNISAEDKGTVSRSSVTGLPSNTSISANNNVLTVGSTEITATATTPGYVFKEWTGIPADGKITSDTKITATFEESSSKYTVTITTDGHGSVTTTEINDVPVSESVSTDGNVLSIGNTEITAVPNDCYIFNGWTGIPSSGRVTENTAVAVSFEYLDWCTSGIGTNENPYIISNVSQLEKLATYVNGSGSHNLKGYYIKLADDFDQSGSLKHIIGTKGINPFCGVFDGANKNITLELSQENVTTADNAGLFGYVGNGTIKNVSTSGIINIKGVTAGGIVGQADNNVLISNCSSSVTISYEKNAPDGAAGGIAGFIFRGIIQNCAFSGSVTSNNNAGGICGHMQNVTIKN